MAQAQQHPFAAASASVSSLPSGGSEAKSGSDDEDIILAKLSGNGGGAGLCDGGSNGSNGIGRPTAEPPSSAAPADLSANPTRVPEIYHQGAAGAPQQRRLSRALVAADHAANGRPAGTDHAANGRPASTDSEPAAPADSGDGAGTVVTVKAATQSPSGSSGSSGSSARADATPGAAGGAGAVLQLDPVSAQLRELANERSSLPADAYDRWGMTAGAPGSDWSMTPEVEKALVAKELGRIPKWNAMLADWPKWLAKRNGKIRSRTRKGVPDRLRGVAWAKLLGVQWDLEGKYDSLVAAECPYEAEILRDVNRTFPHHSFFREYDGHGQTALFSVLKAYAVYDPDVGYCQGMAFVAAILLFYMTEEQAFCMLHHLLARDGLRALYLPTMTLLHEQLWTWDMLLHAHQPAVAKVIDRLGAVPELYASQWFMTLLTYSFPLPMIVRTFDVLMLEGHSIIHRIALAAVRLLRPRLLACKSLEDVMMTMKRVPYVFSSPDEMIFSAVKIKIDAKQLAAISLRYREMQARRAPKT